MKKRLSQQEEFQIMKLVLDKFLWLGFGIMVFGLYELFTGKVMEGITVLVTGIIVLIIFMAIVVREYEVIR